jgi:hypothetical protein
LVVEELPVDPAGGWLEADSGRVPPFGLLAEADLAGAGVDPGALGGGDGVLGRPRLGLAAQGEHLAPHGAGRVAVLDPVGRPADPGALLDAGHAARPPQREKLLNFYNYYELRVEVLQRFVASWSA